MTTPTPAPSAGAQSGAGKDFRDAAGIIAPVGAAGGSSIYGLGSAAGLPVSISSLLPVKTGADGTATAEDVMKAFAHAPASVVAQIQALLVKGGVFYKNGYVPTFGIVNKQDIDAFADATTTAAQTGADLSNYLTAQAKSGELNGAIGTATAKARLIHKADPLALAKTIDDEFKALTGRKATPSEKAGFIAAYNATFTASQNARYDSEAAANGLNADGTPIEAPAPMQGPPSYPDQAGFVTPPGYQDRPVPPGAPTNASVAATPPSVTEQDFDPSAFAEQYVRENAGSETGAHGMAGQFSNFLNILKGGIG